MISGRSLTSALLAVTLVGTARAETYTLAEAPLVGSCCRVELQLSLTGEILVQQEGKPLSMKSQAQARHEYLERVLEAGTNGLASKSARIYQAAEANLVMGPYKSRRTFRPDLGLFVAQRHKDQLVTYCPKGPLTREEVELTEHFDTLAVPGLLPGKAVASGDTWKLSNLAAQALCDLDGLTGHDLTGKLEEVKDGQVKIAVTGTASGIDLGASVKLTVQATAHFDLKTQRIVALQWQQKDEREQGPLSPALNLDLTLTLARTPIEQPAVLGDFSLVPVPEGAPPETMTQLLYQDPKGRYELLHSRDWTLVGRTDEHLVQRLMDQGDFVAQVTIAPWKKAESGLPLPRAEFKEAMSHIPGWEQEEALDKDEPEKNDSLTSPQGYTIYRVAASGKLDGVKAVQFFYLIAGPQGEQVVMTFTLTPAQVSKLGTRDLALVRGLSFPGTKDDKTPSP